MGIGDRFKKKAKDKVTSFKELYNKRGITPESGGGEGAGQEEKKSIFGGLGKAIKGIGKRKCKACGSIDLKFFKEDEKMTSYQCNECNAYSNFYKKKKKKKPTKEPEKGDGEEPGKEGEEGKKKESKPRRGSYTTVALSALAIMGGLFMEIPTALIILCAVFLALGIISFFLPGRLKPLFRVFLLIAFVGSVAFLYWTGGFKDILAVIPPAYAEQIEGTLVKIKEEAIKTYETSKCYTKVDPALVNACLKGLEERKEESVKKLGPYETVELKWGRRLNGDYDYDLPGSGQDYTLDVTFINKNEEIYEINFTKIYASTIINTVEEKAEPKSAFEKYTLDPKEELPVRLKFYDLPSDWGCTGSQNFKVNATTEQKSGGWSDFGMAPSDEDDYRKFVHGFQSNINAEPGPLNIYVFTDPSGIDASEFKDVTEPKDKLEVIIKIQNKVKSGTASISEFYLIQEFEVPNKLFDIEETTCEIEGGLRSYPGCACVDADPANPLPNVMVCSSDCAPERQGSVCGAQLPPPAVGGNDELCKVKQASKLVVQESEKCSGYHNCLKFTFLDDSNNALPYKLGPNEKLTISCKADVINIPSDEYTDQIRVFSSFSYTQEWTKAIECAI